MFVLIALFKKQEDRILLHHRERVVMLPKNKVIHALTILVFTLSVSGIAKADSKMIPLVDVFDLADVSRCVYPDCLTQGKFKDGFRACLSVIGTGIEHVN